MAERRIVDIGPLLEDLKKELEDLEGSTEALTVEEAAEDEIGGNIYDDPDLLKQGEDTQK